MHGLARSPKFLARNHRLDLGLFRITRRALGFLSGSRASGLNGLRLRGIRARRVDAESSIGGHCMNQIDEEIARYRLAARRKKIVLF
jgi:hypothetical protein